MIKKISSILVMLFVALCTTINGAYASNGLELYDNVISNINEEFDTNLYIMDEREFMISPIKDQFNSCYQMYIQKILDTDINEFKEECIYIASMNTEIDVSAYIDTRSTLATKTVVFNAGCNSMTLTYKYSGSKFDTSYKPTATVKKLNVTNYFSMTSYTGVFKNSNTTYSVTANGKIYTVTGVVSNKTFVVNFNL